MGIAQGARVGRYEVLGTLGKGGMGEVYRARDQRLGREVALKILPAAVAADAERLRRFEQEARAAGALDHPNVLVVHDFGTHEDTTFLVTELLEGATLRERLRAGPVPWREALELGRQIADGLAAAHHKGIVHRDLKPENLFLTEDGRIKILDFGLAKVLGGDVSASDSTLAATESGAVLGTAGYMAPEQVRGRPADARADVFAFGAVLYELLAGRRAFEGDSQVERGHAILTKDPPDPSASGVDVPPELGRVLRRCLEKDPAKRYPDAAALRDDLRALQGDLASAPGRPGPTPRSPRGLRVAAGAVVVITLVALGAWWLRQSARTRWVHREALPKLERIVDRIQFLYEGREAWDAFVLARQIEAVAPDEPLLSRLRPKFSRDIAITSDPPGAEVRVRYYDEPDAAPIVLGTTPLTKVRYPRGFTRVEIALPGRQPVEDVIYSWPGVAEAWSYKLHAAGELPDDMVWIPAGASPVIMPGLGNPKPEPTTAFLMDRREVTNRAFKRFVDAGGYADPKHWRQPFVAGGRTLTWNEAVARFVDRTGRPGPATWEVGSYPEGTAALPVGGVSWYEAAAYAEWAGKRLPTIFHWNHVANTRAAARIVPLSNLGGKGPVAVGSTRSLNRFGVHDLAGNVREWLWNASGAGEERHIVGGGWNDPDYAFTDAYAQPVFERSATNGFRCIRALEKDANLAALERTLERPKRDYRAEKPVSDAAFAQYLRLFAYDKAPLAATIEAEKRTPEYIRQKITFSAAYGNERMMAYLFLPKAGKPPYQVVVVFPGSGAMRTRSSESLELDRTDFLVRAGRAVLHPIYKGTFERGGQYQAPDEEPTTAYKDFVVMLGKDLARAIDYVESRPDLDATRVAYYGLSWGASLGAILPAVEARIKATVLYVAGLSDVRALPEADGINYVTRVKQPTLMLNGELDFFFPLETSQRPLFELLGTPAADKKWLVFPGGHSVPRVEQIKESLQWLDRYLGPVGQGPRTN